MRRRLSSAGSTSQSIAKFLASLLPLYSTLLILRHRHSEIGFLTSFGFAFGTAHQGFLVGSLVTIWRIGIDLVFFLVFTYDDMAITRHRPLSPRCPLFTFCAS